MLNLVFYHLRSIIGMNTFFQQITLLSDSLYPRGIISEDMCEIIGCKIVSLLKYIYREDTTLAHLREFLYGCSAFIPYRIIHIKRANLLS